MKILSHKKREDIPILTTMLKCNKRTGFCIISLKLKLGSGS